jgi:hypothetical protein
MAVLDKLWTLTSHLRTTGQGGGDRAGAQGLRAAYHPGRFIQVDDPQATTEVTEAARHR